MTTRTLSVPRRSTRLARLRMIGATALTYAVGLWIVACNPFYLALDNRPPLNWQGVSPAVNAFLTFFVVFFGRTPVECLTRITVVAIVVQIVAVASMDDDDVCVESCRSYVFWRAVYRFWTACVPFLAGRATDGPPATHLSEAERVSIRYYFVKLLFVPVMAGYLYGNLAEMANLTSGPTARGWSVFSVERAYLAAYMTLMIADVLWFGLCSLVETKRFSPVVTVDPYASGWLASLACYPPMNTLAGQYFPWLPPAFPSLLEVKSALVYAVLGLVLWVIYVAADFSFGLKAGNLVYRGLVDKGPYRVIRHPMYATKILAWSLFSIPGLGLHVVRLPIAVAGMHGSMPWLSGQYGLLWGMIAWAGIYAARAYTEERYLLGYPEYRAYCKRVRYRFIPGLV